MCISNLKDENPITNHDILSQTADPFTPAASPPFPVSGWSHICDHGCLEGVIDSEGVITCPVTGRTSQQLVSRQEERAMRRSAADASFRAADQELSSFSLARAYTQGRYGTG